MLDAIEQMLELAAPPAVAKRLPAPVSEQHDAVLLLDGRKHYLFLRAELDPVNRELRVLSIGVLIKPA